MLDIHSTAVVHSRAELDSDVTIGPYSVIGPDVQIGAGTVIGPHVVLDGNTRLGKNNRVHAHATLGGEPQDLKFRGEKTYLIVGNNNTIRESVTMNLASIEGESTVVGDHCLFMVNAHVAHNCTVADHCILANGVSLGGHADIGEHAIIGGHSAVHQFVRVGCFSIVGGCYRTVQDVMPFMMVAGYPLRLTGLNSIGLERNGFDEERRRHLKRAYRILVRSNLNLSQATERLRVEFGSENEDIRMLVDFIESSERGVIT